MAEALHCRSSGVLHEPSLAKLSSCQSGERLAPKGEPLQTGNLILCSPAPARLWVLELNSPDEFTAYGRACEQLSGLGEKTTRSLGG